MSRAPLEPPDHIGTYPHFFLRTQNVLQRCRDTENFPIFEQRNFYVFERFYFRFGTRLHTRGIAAKNSIRHHMSTRRSTFGDFARTVPADTADGERASTDHRRCHKLMRNGQPREQPHQRVWTCTSTHCRQTDSRMCAACCPRAPSFATCACMVVPQPMALRACWIRHGRTSC